MEKLLKEIDSHILEASRAGYTSCAYEVDSDVENVTVKQVMWKLMLRGIKVTRDKRVLLIDWS